MSAPYPNWPERWEFLDGILKYDPDESEEYGGDLDICGIPHMNAVWVVGSADPPPKLHKKKRKRKRGTKKRKRKR